MAPGTALERLRRIGPVFRSKEAVAAGVTWRDLYALRDDGDILELSRGLFQLTDEATEIGNIDFVAVCKRAPQGMVALDSALSYWALTDQIPTQVHLAVPGDSHRPTIDFPPTKVHVFSAATFDLGRIEVGEGAGRFWITDPERTIVDAYRLRHLVGEEEAHGALRRYLDRPRPRIGRLAELAGRLRASSSLGTALRVLQQ